MTSVLDGPASGVAVWWLARNSAGKQTASIGTIEEGQQT